MNYHQSKNHDQPNYYLPTLSPINQQHRPHHHYDTRIMTSTITLSARCASTPTRSPAIRAVFMGNCDSEPASTQCAIFRSSVTVRRSSVYAFVYCFSCTSRTIHKDMVLIYCEWITTTLLHSHRPAPSRARSQLRPQLRMDTPDIPDNLSRFPLRWFSKIPFRFSF
jgi:hypothetical protein